MTAATFISAQGAERCAALAMIDAPLWDEVRAKVYRVQKAGETLGWRVRTWRRGGPSRDLTEKEAEALMALTSTW